MSARFQHFAEKIRLLLADKLACAAGAIGECVMIAALLPQDLVVEGFQSEFLFEFAMQGIGEGFVPVHSALRKLPRVS